MNEIKNGGPAFPEVRIRSGDNYNPPTKVHYGGMTLRDYFAAKAMQAMIARDKFDVGMYESHWTVQAASSAYVMADAMLKARGQE